MVSDHPASRYTIPAEVYKDWDTAIANPNLFSCFEPDDDVQNNSESGSFDEAGNGGRKHTIGNQRGKAKAAASGSESEELPESIVPKKMAKHEVSRVTRSKRLVLSSESEVEIVEKRVAVPTKGKAKSGQFHLSLLFYLHPY